jgi:hypothetical protein
MMAVQKRDAFKFKPPKKKAKHKSRVKPFHDYILDTSN